MVALHSPASSQKLKDSVISPLTSAIMSADTASVTVVQPSTQVPVRKVEESLL